MTQPQLLKSHKCLRQKIAFMHAEKFFFIIEFFYPFYQREQEMKTFYQFLNFMWFC